MCKCTPSDRRRSWCDRCPKDIEYWNHRFSQIAWRKAEQVKMVGEMEKDMEQCKNEIKKLEEKKNA